MFNKNRWVTEEELAAKVLEKAAMRRALFELIWERAHPKPKSVDDRPVRSEPMPRLSDDQIRKELKDLLKGL